MITISLFNVLNEQIKADIFCEEIEKAIILAYFLLAENYFNGNYVLITVTDGDGSTVVTKMTNEN